MKSKILQVGRRFGKLTVIKKLYKKGHHIYYQCKCDCGNLVKVCQSNLITGNSTSCGHCERILDKGDYFQYVSRTGRTFLFSPVDLQKIKKYVWNIGTNGYVYTSSISGKNLLLHRYLFDFPNKTVDHINGDRTDNRRENLRLASPLENSWNHSLNKNNSSGYKGVYFDKSRKKFRTEIFVSGKKKYLGQYDDPIQAAKAYDKAAAFYFGEFAKPNFARKE